MAGGVKKISELVELSASPAAGDLLIINDISEPLDVDKTKKIKVQNLINLVSQCSIQPIVGSQAALDVIYADSATSLARLAKGTALQTLRMNATATGLEWGSSGLVTWSQVDFAPDTQTFSSDTWTDITGATVNITLPIACSVEILATVMGYNSTEGNAFIVRGLIGATYDGTTVYRPGNGGAATARNEVLAYNYMLAGVEAGTVTVKLQSRRNGTNNIVTRGRMIVKAYA